jgi:type II secretion system protein G
MGSKLSGKGFSLIELLVVISIMAVLISLSAFGLQQARENARDGQRKSDIETIRTGLSFYKSDCNAYPTTSAGGDFYTKFNPSFGSNCGGTNTYIEKTPKDPITGRNYWYYSNGITYYICAALETETGTVASCSSADCITSQTGADCNYYAANP